MISALSSVSSEVGEPNKKASATSLGFILLSHPKRDHGLRNPLFDKTISTPLLSSRVGVAEPNASFV